MSKSERLQQRRNAVDLSGQISDPQLHRLRRRYCAWGANQSGNRTSVRVTAGLNAPYDAWSEATMSGEQQAWSPGADASASAVWRSGLGRRLVPDDFPPHVFNTTLPRTRCLLERQGRYDRWGTFPHNALAR
jgi:hypothetical protein